MPKSDDRSKLPERQATDDQDVSNGLLDIVGPAIFAPTVALLFWSHSTPTRVLLAVGLHVGVTIAFAAMQWWAARYRSAWYAQIEELWTVAAGIAGAVLPWILGARGTAGAALLALVCTALVASDTLFLAVRPNRWWKTTASIEAGSFAVYLFVHDSPLLGVFCLGFGFHLVGGYQAIQDLVVRLRRQQAESDRMAHVDYLTGLLNRRGMARHIEESKSSTVGNISVAAIDIDNFKQINERFGHAVGDTAIVAVAKALEERLGDSWSLARAGGDEFSAMSVSAQAPALEPCVGELRLTLAGQSPTAITMSIGVATGPPGDELWKDAGAALRMAKQAGKNRIKAIGDDDRDNLRQARLIGGRLKDAISDRRIVVWAQPIVRVSDASVHSYECLARWIEPDGTLIPPNVFIPMVEDQSLTRLMGESVVDQACRFAAELPPWVSVAVNISASHFVDGSLPSHLEHVLHSTGVLPQQLTVEITESEYFAGESDWLAVARRVRELGVGLSIDDFGSGYSSLERLMQLPFTQLKLDRILVEASSSREMPPLISGLSHFARVAGVELVAEGVEDLEQWDMLKRLDVELCQGFHFARPAPIPDIVNSLRSGQGLASLNCPDSWPTARAPRAEAAEARPSHHQ